MSSVKPCVGVMKVGAKPEDGAPRTCSVEFDAGDQNPMEIYEAFERMLGAWPDARIPLKVAEHQPGDRPPRY